MNRIIKFRAWVPDLQIMIFSDNIPDDYSFECNSNGIELIKFDSDSQEFVKIESFISQSTGLLDSNGVEIYEDDIVKILYTDWASKSENDKRTLDEYLDSISHIGQIKFIEDAAEFSIMIASRPSWELYPCSLNHGRYGRKVIIGNTHTHSHILQPTNNAISH